MKDIFNSEFWNHLAILGSLMIGFTTFRIATCKPFEEEGEEFDWKKLLLGIAKNLIIMLGVCVVFSVATVCGSELLLIRVGDTAITLQSAIDMVFLVVLTVWGVKFIKNLAELFGIADKLPDVTENLPDILKPILGSRRYVIELTIKDTSTGNTYTAEIDNVYTSEILSDNELISNEEGLVG